MDCADPIDSLTAPPGGYATLLDAVALTARGPLQVSRSAEGGYFAKTALLIRAGRTAEIVVPAGRAAVEWGNTGAGPRTSDLRIPPCPRSGTGEWQVYPGGYHVTEPTCLPVEIHAAGRSVTLHVPVGAPCPSTAAGRSPAAG
ncbi:hypothetical protein ADL15_26035 [Actinoplanes awajinensis subsp. mycoplanecinus]|uniref:Uncharacterized protein n=2 Tax=Actinoplanes awajinensis TaxID=135946 RepID=A0A101JND7_9ACTN|nr:hypothetical protein ADL15_26035 [Actinoplanes awajinensis subsp. mycoplanecinus]